MDGSLYFPWTLKRHTDMKIYDSAGTMILDIAVDDSSYRYRAIMGEHSLTLYYSLAEHVEIPVGAYCDYQGERFTLERPEALKMQHSRMFNYTVTMEAVEVLAKRWKFRNPVDGRLKFTLTAKPHEHLQMFVDNMNSRDTGWTVGDCVEGVETLISYDHAYCSDALAQMANEFKTEYEFNGKRVSLRKLEYNKDNPLPLSYGKGNGFKSGVGRTNEGDTPPIEILYTQGGSDNIDPSKYGSTELLLPIAQTLAYDGDKFEGEAGFDAANARTYVTSADGRSIQRSDKPLSSLAEDSLDCSSISPKRVGTVSEVITVDAAQHLYDFTDGSIPQALDYEACLIAGETMTVIFQSGMLAGREFDVKYIHEATEEVGVAKAARRFEIVPQEIDGQTMPNDTFRPVPGDAYAVFHCMLPDAYVCDNATKRGASWDMFREAVRYLYENEEQRFSFTGEMDGIWSKKDWENIGGRLVLGGYIRFSDPRFQPEGVLVRIIGIKDYINKPYSPVIELSNTTVTGGVSSTLKDLVSQEVVNEERHKEALRFTKRRWRDVMETLTMMFDPEGDYFTELIKPLAVHTAQLIVGTNSQQMDLVGVRFIPNKGGNANLFAATAGKLVHFTISEDGVREWTIPATADIALREEEAYYVYAKCPRTGTEGTIICSTQQIKLEDDPNYYHFLVGILNTPYDGSRSWNPNYGYTEIAGETITTGVIKSKNANVVIDLNNGTLTASEFRFYVGNDEVINKINISEEGIKINANRVDITGAVTLTSFSSDLLSSWEALAKQSSDALSEASDAMQKAIDAYDNANTALSGASSAWDKAVAAASDASTALSDAATAKSNAAKAISDAAAAVEEAGSVQGALDDLPAWSKEATMIKALESETIFVNGYISTSRIDTSVLFANMVITNGAKIGYFTVTSGLLEGTSSAKLYIDGGAAIGSTFVYSNWYDCSLRNAAADSLYVGGGLTTGGDLNIGGNAYISTMKSETSFTATTRIKAGFYIQDYSWPFVYFMDDNSTTQFLVVGRTNTLGFCTGNTNGLVAHIDTAGKYHQDSDMRIKNKIDEIQNVLPKLDQLNVFRFTFSNNDKVCIGVSAQDVQKIFPELVDSVDARGYNDLLTLDYSTLATIFSIQGLKELHAKVKALEERVAELEK